MSTAAAISAAREEPVPTDFIAYCCGGPWDGKWVAQPRNCFEVARVKSDWWKAPQPAEHDYGTDFYNYDKFCISGRTKPIQVPVWKHNGKMPTSRQLLAAAASYHNHIKKGPTPSNED